MTTLREVTASRNITIKPIPMAVATRTWKSSNPTTPKCRPKRRTLSSRRWLRETQRVFVFEMFPFGFK